MAIVTTDDSHYKAIADTIRNFVGDTLEDDFGTDKMLPSEMTERIGYAIDTFASRSWEEGKAEGYQEGHANGKAEGITEGKQAEYDRFWDALQNNGDPCLYCNAFSGVAWNKETFKPKYKIKPNTESNSAREMFHYFNFGEFDVTKMAELTYDMLDMSNITSSGQVYAMFQNATFKSIEIDLSGLSGTFNNMFAGNNGGRIHSLRIKVDAATFTNCFNNMALLETLIFEDGSTISGNGFNVQWSTKLSKASITSVVNALSSTTSGLSVTFSKTAVNNAFSGGSTGAEWTALANTKSNWTINLV